MPASPIVLCLAHHATRSRKRTRIAILILTKAEEIVHPTFRTDDSKRLDSW